MSQTISAVDLTGMTDGVPLLVSGTATGTADTVHTADAAARDEVWLWAWNGHSAPVEVTLEIAGAAQPLKVTIPHDDGPYQILPGAVRLKNGKTIKAFASVTNVVKLLGYANRIAG